MMSFTDSQAQRISLGICAVLVLLIAGMFLLAGWAEVTDPFGVKRSVMPAPNPRTEDGPHLQAFARWFREHREDCPHCGGPPTEGVCEEYVRRMREAVRLDQGFQDKQRKP